MKENNKESDLLLIPIKNLKKIGDFVAIKKLLLEITEEMRKYAQETNLLSMDL